MSMTRRMTINRNHDYASSSSKTIKTCDNDAVRPSSDLNHDVLSLVIMQLDQVVDFVAFSKVCKSWRSVALRNKNQFTASKPPMLMCISPRGNNDMECCLEDYEGRKLKNILSCYVGRSYVGLTCGYLIFFDLKINDFWLVNPITRNELYFPPAPCVFYGVGEPSMTSVLVYSPSISRFVFVMLDLKDDQIWYSIEGGRPWKRVSTHCFEDLLVCKGKIYTRSEEEGHLYELTLNPKPELTLLKTKNLADEDLSSWDLVSSGGNLYVLKRFPQGDRYMVRKLDFGKMEWEPFEDTREEHAFSLTYLKYGVAKPESWDGSWLQYWRSINRHDRFSTANKWYFPHECLNVNILDES